MMSDHGMEQVKKEVNLNFFLPIPNAQTISKFKYYKFFQVFFINHVL